MAAITLAAAQAALEKYQAQELAALDAQSYEMTSATGSRAVRMPDLEQIRKGIEYWAKIVDRLSNGGFIPTKRIVPRDY